MKKQLVTSVSIAYVSHIDTTEEFIDKIDLMINALERYRNHLIYESPHKPTERKSPNFYRITKPQ